MEDEIKKKLGRELSEPITSERQVVYILIEVRKLMDRLGIPPTNFRALRFLCNWIAHTELNSGWAQEPLKFFESHFAGGFSSPSVQAESRRILGLETVRHEMMDFFKEQGLNLNQYQMPFKASEWAAFLRNYVSVVSDCPVTVRPNNGSSQVQNATIAAREVPPDELAAKPDYAPYSAVFEIHWSFKLANGDTKRLCIPMAVEKDDGFVFGREGLSLKR